MVYITFMHKSVCLLREFSTDRKFSENIIVKLLKIFKNIFRRKICVSQSHFKKYSL
jgi:hypothetical protein